MALMQHFKFTPGIIEDVIPNSPAFNFGMKDIARMRKELSALILNLSPLYVYSSSSNEDVALTSSDLVMIRSHKQPTKRPPRESSPSRKVAQPRCKQPTKRPPREPSPPRQQFDLFGNNSVARPKAKRSKKTGAQLVARRVVARNAKSMHLTTSKKVSTNKQNNEKKLRRRLMPLWGVILQMMTRLVRC